MSFRLVQKSVTLNDLERRNGHYIALFHTNLVNLCCRKRSVAEFMQESIVFYCLYNVVVKKVHVRYLIS